MTKYSSNNKSQFHIKNKQPNKYVHSTHTSNDVIVPKSNKTTSHDVMKKPLITSKDSFPNRNTTKNKSTSFENRLLEHKILPIQLLDNNVSILDTSSPIIKQSSTDTLGFKVRHGTVDRCYKVHSEIKYRITLHNSNHMIEVDPKLCYHMVQLTSTPNQYKLELHVASINKCVNNKQRLKPINPKDSIKHSKPDYKSHKQMCSYIDACCVFCDYSTMKRPSKEHKRINESIEKDASSRKFLSCSNCQLKSCSECLTSLLSTMTENKDPKDRWFSQVSNFVNSDIVPTTFIGHCCEVKNMINNPMCQKEPQIFSKEIQTGMNLDGHLHFPQLHILLDSPLVNHVDVHGLGKEDPLQGTSGLIHGVVDKYKVRERIYQITHDIFTLGDNFSTCPMFKKTTIKIIVRLLLYGRPYFSPY